MSSNLRLIYVLVALITYTASNVQSTTAQPQASVRSADAFNLIFGATSRASVASNGTEANGPSQSQAVSADGRFVAFTSNASNLVSDDTNGTWDVFVYDRSARQATRVSVASNGAQANSDSYTYSGLSLSGDGRFVAFASDASTLVSNDTNNVCDTNGDGVFAENCPDVFVHDRQTAQTSRISVSSNGSQGNGNSYSPSISADGRYAAFESFANNLVPGRTGIFVHDRTTGQTTYVSAALGGAQANGQSMQPSISADGRFVAFSSFASNLIVGDTNGVVDAFVHDRQTGQTTRVSVASDGTQGNSGSSWLGQPVLSADGRYVAFYSNASNLVSGDTNNNCTGTVPPLPGGNLNCPDIFVKDRQTGATTLISRASDGVQGNHGSFSVSISSDGRYVAFYSDSTNLMNGDTNNTSDIFVHDRQTGLTTRASISSDGTQGNSSSFGETISTNGRYVTFISSANNLVVGDTNNATDVFVHDRRSLSGTITLPIEGDTIGPATLQIAAEASDDAGIGIQQVEFSVFYDGSWHSAGVDAVSPYQVSWQTPNSLRSQQLGFSIHLVANDGYRVDYASDTRYISFVESLGNPAVTENWAPVRAYLNQRSIQPWGDCRCSATSMAMVLAMNGVIAQDYTIMHDKVIEMYERVAVGSSGCRPADWSKMADELNRQGIIAGKNLLVTKGWYSTDSAWNKIKQETDMGRPVIVRTQGVTSNGHIIVSVGYRETGSSRQIIAYDPYGHWQGALNIWNANSREPSSRKGQWVYYDFDKIFGGILITAQRSNVATSMTQVAGIPSTPPDVTSDETPTVDTFSGIADYGFSAFLPLIQR